MSDKQAPEAKQPFLSEDTPAEVGRTEDPRPSSAGPVLHGNDFLQPRGNVWMWVGFLIVPFIVLLFGFLQGAFERNDDVAAEAQALEVIAEQPAQRAVDESEGEYNPALRRRIRR